MESRWEVPNGFWELDWFSEIDVPKKLLSFSRHVDFVQACLADKLQNQVNRQLLGVDQSALAPVASDSIADDIWSTLAWMNTGQDISEMWLKDLENRSEEDAVLHIEASILHVQGSMTREMLARQRLSESSIPFVFPGEVVPLHIELFAGGEKALHVLHVELLQKLGKILVDSIDIDCQNRGTWLLPLIEVLPENKLKRKIQTLTTTPTRKQQRLFTGGGWGVLAAYGQRIGLEPEAILERGNQMDRLFWIVLSEHLRHTVG